jgi:uncharacterized protein involved in outer membrane biogenesis
MSIWKSPVFYFGVLLVVLVTAALAAPYVVTWNNYRGQLESYGQKLTGRDVSIAGDIAVKLFPWPQLQARDVSIGNPTGFSEGAFVRADIVRVRLALGGLINGSLDVEQVEIEKPTINLQRNATGAVNWIFAPREQVTGRGLLSRVKLDKILLNGGVVSFDDLRNGNSTVVTGLNATLSAQSILGPWRMQGIAKWNDILANLTVVTSQKEKDQALNFTTKFAPLDVVYPHAALEGSWDGSVFKGALRIDPQPLKGEKASAEGALKPLAIQAQVEASEQRMSLLKIRIAPSDRKDSGTLIEGDAVVEFGTQSIARVDLKSPRINMDTLVGAAALKQWRDGGFLSLGNLLFANMPAKLVADYRLNISVLTSGGQALNDVRLSGSLQKEALRILEFTAELPGRSVGVFDGIMFPGQNAAQLGGKFKFESADARAFLSWVKPDWKDKLAAHWTGNRGRLAVQSGTLDWTRERIALEDVVYQFDGAAGVASLNTGFDASSDVNVTIESDRLDVDSLVPNGWSLVRDGGFPTLVGMLGQQDATMRGALRLAIKIGAVVMNGVTAENALLSVVSDAKGFEIKSFDIGNVSGARLQGGGALVDSGDGPDGVLNFNLAAQDPRGFLRLTGLEYGAGNWTEALGVTQFDAKLTATPQKSGPEVEMVVRGSSGALNAEIVVTARELEKGSGMSLAASGGLSSADSAVFAKLVGVVPVGAMGAGDVTFEFDGSVKNGFAFSTRMKALDAVADVEGTAKIQQAFMGVAGKVSLNAADGRAVVQAMGIPLTATVLQPLNLTALVAARDGGLSFIDVQGNAAGRRFSGTLDVAADRRITGDVETDVIDAKDVLTLAFMPWSGVVTDMASSFATLENQSLTGEVFIRPLQFETLTGPAQEEAVIGFGFGRDGRRLSISSPGERSVQADVVMKPRGASFDFTGSLRWPVLLTQVMTTVEDSQLMTGEMVAKAEFKSTGRSPASVAAALEGKGNYWLSNATISRIALDGFAASVLAATTPDALTLALAQLNGKAGTDVGQRTGSFELRNGEMVLSPVRLNVDEVEATVAPTVDFSSGVVRVVTAIALKQRPDLPAVTITYDGSPSALAVRNGTSALAAKLGYALLSKEMERLEQLQQEQEKLIKKEEAQRAADEQRFVDYQATRAELRQQARVRRFHAGERTTRAANLKTIVDSAIKTSAAQSRIDLQRHGRRLAVRRAGRI